MSSITNGLRRAAVVGLSAAVATSLMTGLAGNASAADFAPGVVAVAPTAEFTNTAKVAALPSAPNVPLGTQTFTENTAAAYFPAGTTTSVALQLSGATSLTAGVTPTVTVPSGYATTSPVTTAAGLYTFTVTAPATAVAATVTVSGLTLTAPAAAQTLTLGATVGANPVTPVLPVVNVLTYDERTGGPDRYATAVALLNLLPPDTDVVLSSGVNFPDALSASYLAGQLGTGILLTTPETLPTVVRQAIALRGVSTVYITGGTGAVSQRVQDQIEAMHVGDVPAAPLITVVRLGGANRYVTNQIINAHTFVARSTVLLATGKDFADALSVGPIANHKLFPLILTRGATLGADEIAQLGAFNPTNVVIAGGTGVVSAAIESALTARGYTVLRLAGADRTLTAAAVATWATDGVAPKTGVSADQGFDSHGVHITTGDNFADGLAGGPLSGFFNHVIMPSRSPTSLGAGIPAYLGTKTVGPADPQVGVLHAFGQTGAVSDALMKQAAATIG